MLVLLLHNDASNLRLRELSVGYTFKDLLGASKNLSLSFVARNLCFLYKSCPVDPDISASTSNGMGGIDVFAMPTSRSYGLNIKVHRHNTLPIRPCATA